MADVLFEIYIKNPCQYIFVKIFKIMLACICYEYNLSLVRWGCLYMVVANIVTCWSCSKFWRSEDGSVNRNMSPSL
jgi:hypothetical protein